jgi:hypothetical protein
MLKSEFRKSFQENLESGREDNNGGQNNYLLIKSNLEN